MVKKNNKISKKQKEILKLEDENIDVIRSIVEMEKQYKDLISSELKNPEEYLYGLPIEELKHLDPNKRVLRLPDMYAREKIKKNKEKAIDLSKNIENRIAVLKIELVQEKIKELLKNGQ